MVTADIALFIRIRSWATFVEIADKIEDVADVNYAVAISICGPQRIRSKALSN